MMSTNLSPQVKFCHDFMSLIKLITGINRSAETQNFMGNDKSVFFF